MKPNQINIDGVLYDLTPAQQDSVNHTSAVNTRYEPAAAADPERIKAIKDAGLFKEFCEIVASPEAKAKEWEINCIQLWSRNHWLQKDGKYSSELFQTHIELDSLLSNPNRIIHSVRRLSDNEVFAVGQRVVRNEFEDEISRFEADGERMKVIFRGDEVCGAFDLSVISLPPARTPLFTTTDGEEISESQSLVLVFAVTPKWEIMECSAEFANPNTYKEKAGQEPLFKVFFHKQNAVDYIADNKPLYSLNDIQKALHGEWGTQNAVDNVLNKIRNSKK